MNPKPATETTKYNKVLETIRNQEATPLARSHTCTHVQFIKYLTIGSFIHAEYFNVFKDLLVDTYLIIGIEKRIFRKVVQGDDVLFTCNVNQTQLL